jgi:hypothetical protein
MLATTDGISVRVKGTREAPQGWRGAAGANAVWLPDLDDWATFGCLLAMLEEARPWRWGLRPCPNNAPVWRVELYGYTQRHDADGATLGEAVGLALLEAWGER